MQSSAIALSQIILFLHFDFLTGLNGYQQQIPPNSPLFTEGINVNVSYISPSLNGTKAGFSFNPQLESIRQSQSPASSSTVIPQVSQPIIGPSFISDRQYTPRQHIPQKEYVPQQQAVPQNQFNPIHQYTPQNPFTAQSTYNPQHQQHVFFPSNPYLQQIYQNRNSNYNGQQPYSQNPFENSYQHSGYPKMPPIFIDPAIGRTLYNAPMYMKRRTIQEICSAYAPEEKTVIYVLSQSPEFGLNNIELPPPPKPNKPEVVFIKYKTPEEAELVQQQIQAQYDALGGTSEVNSESFGNVNTVEKFLRGTNSSLFNSAQGGY